MTLRPRGTHSPSDRVCLFPGRPTTGDRVARGRRGQGIESRPKLGKRAVTPGLAAETR